MLIDKYMKSWDKHEIHTRCVPYPADICFRVISQVNWTGSMTSCLYKNIVRVVNCFRPSRKMEVQDLCLEVFIDAGFFVLENNGVEEIVIGSYSKITGQRPPDVARPTSAEEYINFNVPGCYKLIWNIRVIPVNATSTMLYTESRVVCTDALTRKLFSVYWFFINKGSALTRLDLLRSFERQIASSFACQQDFNLKN